MINAAIGKCPQVLNVYRCGLSFGEDLMTSLPEQRKSYPYANMGYDIKTMWKSFAGYGEDLLMSDGYRVSTQSQVKLGMNFLMTLQNHFGQWTLNELVSYSFVMNSTIVGELVGVKDVAHECNIRMSTASKLILKLEEKEFLESYPCIEDKRRKWLRMHPRVVHHRIANGDHVWAAQRKLLEKILISDRT